MKIYIDTNTFPAAPGIYADAEKTKPLPRIIPAVELERGGLEVAFLGENIPAPTDALAIAASIDGTRTQVIAEYGVPVEDAPQATWLFQFALNSEELVKAVEARGSTHLRVGIIATAGEQKRTEWQFLAAVYATASGEIDEKQVESAKDWSDTAMRFAQAAEDSAKFADKKAQEAKVLALNASGFADAAKKSETAANNSATAASQSAQNAANSATQAGNAATNAKTSRQAAETAKNAAEKAKTDAETTLQSVQQEAEDVEAAGEQAIENIGEAKNDALNAIEEARGNVYTKDQVYTKSEIDGVATGAEVVLKMNEIIAQLKDYEEVTGEKLPFDFWEAVMEEFQRWQESPNEVKEWVNGQNPYYSTPPSQKCVVDFNVTSASGTYSGYLYSFAPPTSAIVYLPGCTYANYAHSNSSGSVVAIYAVATSTSGLFRNSNCESVFYAPNSTSVDSIYINAKKAPKVVWAPKGEVWPYAFQASIVDMFVDMRSARVATAAFRNSKMSAESISKTLDSLPTWTDGASHVITFTGSPGAAHVSTTETITIEIDGQTYTFENFPRFTMDDENETLRYSVARATAKGWEVQMGDPQ